jgi:hypothetical protein
MDTIRKLLWPLWLALWLLPLGFTAVDRAMVGAAEPPLQPDIQPQDAGTVSSACGASYGTRFNLEPRVNALPQHTESVDFLRNRVAAGVDLVVGAATDHRDLAGVASRSGYYVNRDADCAPEFEGGLPRLTASSSEVLDGFGKPVVAADPARGAIFTADLRDSSSDESASAVAIGLFRTPAATLLNATACPDGTHTAAQSLTCWPTRRLARTGFPVLRGPHLAVDERASGPGAGNVYLVFADFQFEFDTRLLLVACTNSLATCTAPVTIDFTHVFVGGGHVAVRPDGQVTITWVTGDSFGMSVQYLSCPPATPPAAPTCGSPSVVHTWFPVDGNTPDRLVAYPADLVLTRRPQHAHRLDANGTETYVVWDQCKTGAGNGLEFCPDADVVMKASRDNGATWSALTCVSCVAQDQFLPAVAADRSRNIINIALYSSSSDATFQRRVRLILYHINPGSATPDPVDAHVITTLLNDPSGDPHKVVPGSGFGESLGIAARGTGVDGQSRAYVHYTYHNIQGTYNGQQVPEPNNHLSRLDY